MAFTMNVAAYVRRYGKQPDHLYDKESKFYRKVTNRKWRKRSRLELRDRDIDWERHTLPLPPKTGGWLTI